MTLYYIQMPAGLDGPYDVQALTDFIERGKCHPTEKVLQADSRAIYAIESIIPNAFRIYKAKSDSEVIRRQADRRRSSSARLRAQRTPLPFNIAPININPPVAPNAGDRSPWVEPGPIPQPRRPTVVARLLKLPLLIKLPILLSLLSILVIMAFSLVHRPMQLAGMIGSWKQQSIRFRSHEFEASLSSNSPPQSPWGTMAIDIDSNSMHFFSQTDDIHISYLEVIELSDAISIRFSRMSPLGSAIVVRLDPAGMALMETREFIVVLKRHTTAAQ